jgi:hypothetical protein
MSTCAVCGKQFDNYAGYCDQCGSIPAERQTLRPSLASTVTVLVALGVIVLIGAVVRSPDFKPPSPPPKQEQPQRPVISQDDVARAVANCGKPDSDKTAPVNKTGKPTAVRTLMYKQPVVRLRFVPKNLSHSSQQQWVFDSARSLKTDQRFTREQLLKRMPCMK